MLGAVAILISQYLIWTSWEDAKFGTIGNGFILLAVIIGWGAWNFNRNYRNEVKEGLSQDATSLNEIVTEADIQNLPEPVKKYLYYTGTVGKPRVSNFKAEFYGQLRQSEDAGWMPFTSQQYNFVKQTTRLFFLKAKMKNLPVVGFHCFKNGSASMDIRLFSLFKLQYQTGKEMNIAETVTFFNDMCVLAPPTLLDSRVKWVSIEKDVVKAQFTDNGITISASLYFNEKGELINFISDDRYATMKNGVMEKVQWSTPVGEYKYFNGYKLPTYAETIYKFPDGDFCYGNFRLSDITFNAAGQ